MYGLAAHENGASDAYATSAELAEYVKQYEQNGGRRSAAGMTSEMMLDATDSYRGDGRDDKRGYQGDARGYREHRGGHMDNGGYGGRTGSGGDKGSDLYSTATEDSSFASHKASPTGATLMPFCAHCASGFAWRCSIFASFSSGHDTSHCGCAVPCYT